MASGSPPCSRSPRLPGSGPRQLGQVEISPFKPARANQGLARPAVPTRGAAGLGSRPPGRRRRSEGERLSLLPGLPAATQPRPGDRPSCPGRNRDAMERSLHRVSLGSRRAHPNLSFYLTTFGKCLWARLPVDRFLGNPSQKSKRPPWQGGYEQVLFPLGHLLWPLPPGPASQWTPPAAGRRCQLHLVLPHLVGIIMPQFIFQRPAFVTTDLPISQLSG